MPESKQAIARQIASLLMQIQQLPQGDELVRLFGTGHETTNLDAIAHWVESNLNEIDDEKGTLQRLKHAALNQAPACLKQGRSHAAL